jgi:hypothetical protein
MRMPPVAYTRRKPVAKVSTGTLEVGKARGVLHTKSPGMSIPSNIPFEGRRIQD